MTSGEVTVTIDAPPERVWPWVADLGKHAAFSPKPYSVEWIEGEPNAVGSRYRSVGEIPTDKRARMALLKQKVEAGSSG